MNKTKRNILSVTAVILLVAIGVGYYSYNKPARDVASAEGKKVMAVALYESFAKDSVYAKKSYAQQILQVSGVVTQVARNQQSKAIILLKTNTDGASVNCTMEGPSEGIVTGSTVQIKGICSGMGEGDAELGIMGDVYLVRCYAVKMP
jgi:hypothetical protein